jgi:outer membrane receptor protein involved in Fe transport
LDDLELRAGVNNLFDKNPPIIGAEAGALPTYNGNTQPGTWDTLGRTLFLGGTLKL